MNDTTSFSLTSVMSAVLSFPATVADAVADLTGSETAGAIAGGLTIAAAAIVTGVAASAVTAAVGGVMGELAGVAVYLGGAIMTCESMRYLGLWTATKGMSLAWSWLATAAIPFVGAGLFVQMIPGFGIEAINVLLNDTAILYAGCAAITSAIVWPFSEHQAVSKCNIALKAFSDGITKAAEDFKAGMSEEPVQQAQQQTRQDSRNAEEAVMVAGNPALARAAQEACGHVDGAAAAGFMPA